MDRQIRLFVSSTFLDMQEERDVLARACFPAARRRFARADTAFAEIDLRWGLPETAGEASIVGACLAEVRRCRGHFIGILGSRYGFVPAGDPTKRSITEIEIQQGAFDAPPSSFIRFYFKDGAVDEQPALSALKARILQRFPVTYYRSAQHLAELVLQDLSQLAATLPVRRGTQHRRAFDWHLRQVNASTSRSGLRALNTFLSGKERLLCVLGPSGAGKTALLASWFDAHRGERIGRAPRLWERIWRYVKHWGRPPRLSGPLWLIHCAGDVTDAGGLRVMLDTLISQLRVMLGEPEPDDGVPLKDKLLAFHRLLGRAASRHEAVLLVIDDADALFLDLTLPFHWLPPAVSNLKVILSGRSSGTVAHLPAQWQRFELDGLSRDEQRAALSGYLNGYGKALPQEAVECITAVPGMRRPLALRLAADELRLAESPVHLAALLAALAETRDALDLIHGMLDRLEREHGRPLVSTLCGLLACSRGGLWESELRAIVQEHGELSAVQWSSIMQAFGRSAIDHDGLYALHFEELVTAVHERYLSSPQAIHGYRRQLISWLYHAREQECIPARRIVDELPWQLCQEGDWQALRSLLIDPAFFIESWKVDPSQVIAGWRLVEKNCATTAARAWSVATSPDEQDALLQTTLALLYAELGHPDDAAACIGRLLLACQHSLDNPDSFANLVNLAGFLLESEQAGPAAESLGLAEALLPSVPHPALRAIYYNTRGNLELCNSQAEAAMGSYRQAEELHMRLRNYQAIAECRHNLALGMMGMERYSDASKLLRHCSDTFRLLHDIELLCKAMLNLSIAQRKCGRLPSALKHAREAESLAKERQDWSLHCKVLQERARIQELIGDRDGAEAAYLECEGIYRRHGAQQQEIDIVVARAVVRTNLGTRGYQAALQLLAGARRMAASAGSEEQRARISALQTEITNRLHYDIAA